MSELHLTNAFTVLSVFAILVLIFLANFVIPPLYEKTICGLQGGQWDTMLRVCAFNPKICADAGGTPVQVSGRCNHKGQCNTQSVSTLGCKFE